MVDQLPSIFTQYKSNINSYLKSGLQQKSDFKFNSSKENLYKILSYGMGWTDKFGKPVNLSGGKLLRPTLCLFAADATGESADKAIQTAVALEYIHNFSLFHDDIQDQDEIRHHRPTVWYIWGKPKAIVAGNVLRSIADVTLSELLNYNVGDSDAVTISKTMTTGYLEMIEGKRVMLDSRRGNNLNSAFWSCSTEPWKLRIPPLRRECLRRSKNRDREPEDRVRLPLPAIV